LGCNLTQTFSAFGAEIGLNYSAVSDTVATKLISWTAKPFITDRVEQTAFLDSKKL
jgi:hypothetical protein